MILKSLKMWSLIYLLPANFAFVRSMEPATLAQVIEITGVVGGKVEFVCDVSVESTDHPDLSWKPTEQSALLHRKNIAQSGHSNFRTPHDPLENGYLVLWFYENERKPIYSYDARAKTNFGNHWSDPTKLGKRAWFISDEQTGISAAKLQLTDLVEEDAGIYRCRVDYKKAPSKYFKFMLNIIVPPKAVTIIDGEERILGVVAGPLEVSSTLILTCSASGGFPSPHISWWHGAALFDNTTDKIVNNVVRNTMIYQNVERSSLHDTFTCQVSQPPPALPILRMVSLELLLEPLLVTLELPLKPLVANQTSDIKCRAVGSRPATLLSWWIAGKQLIKGVSTKNTDDGNITVSILSFIPDSGDDGKHITCRVENPMLPGTALEDTFRINVQYPPKALIEYGSKINADDIKEGEDTYMECKVEGNPKPHKLQWLHNNSPVLQNTSGGIILSNYSLVLQRLTLARSGHYACKATNLKGETLSNELELRIQYAPKCKTDEVIKVAGSRGETSTLVCEIDADPIDVHFWWTFTPISSIASEAILLPRSSFILSGLVSVLKYMPKNESDFGTIGCWASNNAGSQKKPCLYHLITADVIGRPSPVKNCIASNISFDAFRVSCDASWDGGLPQTFELEVLDPWSRQILQTLSSSTCWFEVRGLEPNYPFLIVVYATNSKGRSEEVALEVQTFKEHDNESGQTLALQFYMTPLFAILAGAAGTVFVLLGVIGLIVHRQQQLRKRHRREAVQLEAEKHTLAASSSWSDSTSGSKTVKVDPDLLHHQESYVQALSVDERLAFEILRPSELPLSDVDADALPNYNSRTLGNKISYKQQFLDPFSTLSHNQGYPVGCNGEGQGPVSGLKNLPESSL